MYGKRVQYAMDHFIMDQYFLPMSNLYHLREKEDSGKSDLNVTIENENLCIYDFDSKKRCNFLRPDKKYGMQKSVDHILFEKRSNDWRLHLIEMKSGVGCKTWRESIKPKVRVSYFTALAIADFLGIRISDVIAYTTYEKERFGDINNGTNPRTMMPLSGLPARNPVTDEWEKNQMFLNVGEEMRIPHKKIQMVKNSATGVLEGSLVID